jgi:hypothetical protein
MQETPYTRQLVAIAELDLGGWPEERIQPYQRMLDPRWVQKIVRDFDPHRPWDDIDVNRIPDGRLKVVEGQHRIAVARLMGWTHLWARVHTNLSVEDQARIYNTNAGRKNLTAGDRFRGALYEGKTEEIMVDLIVRRAGFRVNMDNGATSHGQIPAVGTLLQILNRYREGTLEAVLRLVADAYGTGTGPKTEVLGALAAFLARYRDHPNYHRSHLVAVLRQFSLTNLKAEGELEKISRNTDTVDSLGHRLWRTYNHRKLEQNRLPGWDEMNPRRRPRA